MKRVDCRHDEHVLSCMDLSTGTTQESCMPPRIPELTLRQEEALRVYRRMTERNEDVTPTVRAFAEKLGCSRTAAHQLLMHLREKGYLKMPPVTQTRLRFTAKGKKAV